MNEDQKLFTDGHAKSILMTMNNLRKNHTLCDITLKVEGQTFSAHRIVLAACSDYFCAMFTHGMQEMFKSEVELHGVCASVMEVLLDFVYTETVHVTVENVQELLPAACLLQLTGVKQACSEFLEKQLEAANCLGICDFAEAHSADSLYAAAQTFTYRHFQDVAHNDEFKSLSFEKVEQLISCELIQADGEEPVFESVVTWVNHDKEERSKHLATLLKHVRLPLLSAKYITDIVDNELLIRRDHDCRDLIDEAKKFHLRPDLRGQMHGKWTQPRLGSDDILVVIGGFGHSQNPVDVVEKFDPKTQEWSKLPKTTSRRRYVTATSIKTKVFVIGGYDGHVRLNTVECLNLGEEKPSWTTVASMHHRRGLAAACTYQDQIYVCGGYDGTLRHTTMERYDPTMERWTLLTDMSESREGAGLVVSGDQIYCIGGYDGLSLLNTVEKYDPATSTWHHIKSMNTKRSGAGVTVLNDMIYVCGGYDGSNHLETVECYNTRTGNWTMITSMSSPRCYVGACILKGKLYAVAGYDGSTLLNSVECYDPSLENWELLEAKMSSHRCDAGLAVLHMK